MSNSKFDPTSRRAIQGLAYQESVLSELADVFFRVSPIRDWLKDIDVCLNSNQLNMLEQVWGDIVVFPDESLMFPVFVECVSLNFENSRFPESKIRKFVGDNRFYAFGWEGAETKFISSAAWNSYASKLEMFSSHGRKYRKFSRYIINNVRKSCCGASEFKSLILD